MNAHTLQVRIVGLIIILAAIAASFIVAVNLRPGGTAGAATVDQCTICMKSGGVTGSGGNVGTGTGGVTGGTGGSVGSK